MNKTIYETDDQRVLRSIVDFSNDIAANGKARGDITPQEAVFGASLAAVRIVHALGGEGSVYGLPPYGMVIILPDVALKDQKLYDATMADFRYVRERYFATGAEK